MDDKWGWTFCFLQFFVISEIIVRKQPGINSENNFIYKNTVHRHSTAKFEKKGRINELFRKQYFMNSENILICFVKH